MSGSADRANRAVLCVALSESRAACIRLPVTSASEKKQQIHALGTGLMISAQVATM